MPQGIKDVATDKTDSEPLLRDELTQIERSLLHQVVLMPGFKVIIKLANAACQRFNDNVIKLNPETQDFKDKVTVRQLEAWTASKYSSDLFKSMEWHTQQVTAADQKEEQETDDAVKAVFGYTVTGPKKQLLKQPKLKTVK